MSQPLRTTYLGRTIEINCPFQPGRGMRGIFASVIRSYIDRGHELFFRYPGAEPSPKRGVDSPARYFWQGYDNKHKASDYSGTSAHPVYMAGVQMRRWLDKNNIVEFQEQPVEEMKEETILDKISEGSIYKTFLDVPRIVYRVKRGV